MKNLKQNSQTQTMFLKIEQQFGRLEKACRRCRQESLIILLRTCQHHDHNAVKKEGQTLYSHAKIHKCNLLVGTFLLRWICSDCSLAEHLNNGRASLLLSEFY